MTDAPLVSLVILLDDRGIPPAALRAHLSQRCAFRYEILIIDSRRDKRPRVCADDQHDPPVRIIPIDPDSFEFGRTRDLGFRLARGRFVVTLSQDVVPTSDAYLAEMVDALCTGTADVVQGSTCLPRDGDVFFWERHHAFYFTSESSEFTRQHGGIGLSACSLAMTRAAWADCLFSPALFSEDKVIQRRLSQKGYRIVMLPAANASHGHTYTLRDLIRRCWLEGLGWRCAQVTYSLRSMTRDLLLGHWRLGPTLFRGILSGEARDLPTCLFLLVRPTMLFLGNHSRRIRHMATSISESQAAPAPQP